MRRRQLLLFAVALLLPYAVLVALAFRMAVQDRELSRERSGQEQRQAARDAAMDALARLEEIRRGENLAPLQPGERYRRKETAFVGWVEEDRLALPWEENAAARASRERIAAAPFASRLRDCERLEGLAGGLRDAARCYQEAARTADAVQAAWARLLGARAHDRAGDAALAEGAYRELLETPALTTDEDGVPIRLYAVQRLAALGGEVAARATEAVAERPWLPPLACYVASDAADKLAGGAVDAFRARIAAHVRLVEQAQALQEQFPRQAPPAGGQVWTSFGDEMWLLASLPQAAGSRPALLAVRAAEVLRPVEERRGLRFVPVHEPRGEALGQALPGLKAVIEPLPGAGRTEGGRQRTLFYASLGLLAAAMVFAAWLLWRDLQREVRVSEMRSQFVSSVSHELKTPLTAIRMLAETLQMGRGRDSETQDRYLETIVHECERLGRLVDGVLLFSRVEQQRKVFRFRALDVGESVRAAIRTMEHPLSQRGFRLALAVEPDLPPVEADDDSLQQAVLNLLGNAMKYSGDARDIEVSVGRAGASVEIRVADHGIGIPAAEQGRIWEKFYRAETPENRHIPGAGLGLALVAQIAKAHGGSVEVQSESGKGSAFKVLLPVKESV